MEVTEHTVLGPNTGLIATASWWRQLDSPCGFWSHSITLALTHSHVSLVKSLNFSAPTSQGPRANLTNLKCRQQSQAAAAVTSLALGPQKWLLWVCSQNPYECWDWGPMITKVGMQIGTPYLGAP